MHTINQIIYSGVRDPGRKADLAHGRAGSRSTLLSGAREFPGLTSRVVMLIVYNIFIESIFYASILKISNYC